MKTAFLRGLAALVITVSANSAFAQLDTSITGTLEPGVAKLKPLKPFAASANGLPLDIVVINFAQPQDNFTIVQTLPIKATITGNMSSRAFKDDYSGNEIEVQFVYDGKLFDKVVYRRTTISVAKGAEPVVKEFRPPHF